MGDEDLPGQPQSLVEQGLPGPFCLPDLGTT